MLRFLARRLLTAIPVILGVVILVYVLARVIPGDPCKAALGERATKQACDAYTARSRSSSAGTSTIWCTATSASPLRSGAP